MRYKVTTRTETIRQNTKLDDTKYGGWLCVNTGTAPVTVLGIELQPSEGLDFTSALQPGDIWVKPIDITVQAGGELRLVRMIYQPISED